MSRPMRRVERAEITPRGLRVTFSDGTSLEPIDWRWLRDHDQSPEGRDPETGQRRVDSIALPDEPAETARVLDGGRTIEIAWPDQVSRLGAGLLGGSGPSRTDLRLWEDAQDLPDGLPSISWDAVADSDDGVLRWLSEVERWGAALLTGVPATLEATGEVAPRIGYIRRSIFGGLWDFTADMAWRDSAYGRGAIDLHTDGTYTFDPPGLQMFHCLRFEGDGGESLLADGFAAARALQREAPEHFETLCRVDVPARYLDDGVDLRARHPILTLGRDGRLRRVCFNNADRAPMWLPLPRMRAFYDALGHFGRLLRRPAARLTLRLEPGTVLLFDNWRVLHGRAEFTGTRRLAGAYVNREDFESRLRTLRANR